MLYTGRNVILPKFVFQFCTQKLCLSCNIMRLTNAEHEDVCVYVAGLPFFSCGRACWFMIGCNDIFIRFCGQWQQTCKDSMERKNFQPISNGTELLKVTSGPISTAGRDLIRQMWFYFLNSAVFWLAVDYLDCWKYVYISMTYKPHICMSKLKSLHNRPAAVTVQEQWHYRLNPKF